VIALAAGLSYFDLSFLGRPRIIATGVLHGPGGVALVDPGPSSTLATLRRELSDAGIAMRDVTALLLTHIHLDHSGATGTLLRELPGLRVYVHEKGAAHLVNPEKLLASAARLYGADMDRLWGEVAPVPAHTLAVLKGSERISAAGRTLDVEYTPGHASHHVSYFDRSADVAFAGDVAGIKLTPGGFVLPPTPPPDIDLEAWRDSLSRLDRWKPGTFFVTHFGPASADGHVASLRDHLELVADLGQRSLARDGPDEAREAWFTEEVRRELRRRLPDAEVEAYEVAGRFDLNWRGLARYWRKKNV